jgi:mannose-6-phosphate isomerase-like protein (cupin superfamily)
MRLSKEAMVERFRKQLIERELEIIEIDATRPWGAFLRVADRQADEFVRAYFEGVVVPESARHGERSPKILLVAPGARLSWQYHERRAEYWRAVSGTVGVFVSATDEQPPAPRVLRAGETIELPGGMRHRLVGLDSWGAVAEIWIHADPLHLSNEEDIRRLQDDYQRK